MRFAILAALFASVVFAQPTAQTRYVIVDPAGLCGPTAWVSINIGTGNMMGCVGSPRTWTSIGGGGGGAAGSADNPSWMICTPAGCGSESSNGYYHIKTPAGVTFDECGGNLAIGPTGSSVIVQIQTSAGSPVCTLTFTVGNGTATVFSTSMASSPYTAAKGAKFRAVVTQNDSGGTAQFAYIGVRVH